MMPAVRATPLAGRAGKRIILRVSSKMNTILNRQDAGPAPAGCKPGVAKKDYYFSNK